MHLFNPLQLFQVSAWCGYAAFLFPVPVEVYCIALPLFLYLYSFFCWLCGCGRTNSAIHQRIYSYSSASHCWGHDDLQTQDVSEMVSTILSFHMFLIWYFLYIFLFYPCRQDDDSYQNFVPFVGVSAFYYTTVHKSLVGKLCESHLSNLLINLMAKNDTYWGQTLYSNVYCNIIHKSILISNDG